MASNVWLGKAIVAHLSTDADSNGTAKCEIQDVMDG